MSMLREKILSAANDLFYSRGINSTGVDTIVAVAGTTKMTLYKYFRTKDELILEVLQKNQRDFHTWLSTKLSTQKPKDQLKQLFDFVEEWVESPQFNGLGFIQASAEFPNEENPIHQLSQQQSRQFKQFIVELAIEAGIQDAQSLALQLAILFEGAMQAEQLQRGSSAMMHAKKAAKILISGAAQSQR